MLKKLAAFGLTAAIAFAPMAALAQATTPVDTTPPATDAKPMTDTAKPMKKHKHAAKKHAMKKMAKKTDAPAADAEAPK